VPNLPKDTTFQQFQFRCHQIVYGRDIAEREHHIPISINALARAFDCTRSSLQWALAHGWQPPGERGKHFALDADHEQQILNWIQQKAEQSTPVEKTEIKNYCTTQVKVLLTRGWVNSFVLRHSDQIFKTKSTSQEQQCLQVPRMFLERTVQDLKEHVQKYVAELVFNLDEVGLSDWEDPRPKTVIVPATMRGQTIHHDISRTVKHISVIAWVSAAGESLTPYIITSQAPTSNPSPCINAEIFLDDIRTIF
jgi:transposase